ncbi:MAG: hypothetical protein ACYTHJ_06830 [Planctomycetota bacterium]|jgi:hypothetical protein
MPRPWIETVQPWPSLDGKQLYRCIVASVEKSRSPAAIIATIEHADTANRGRTHRIALPLPIRPGGLTSDFFNACGLGTSLTGLPFCEAYYRETVRRNASECVNLRK